MARRRAALLLASLLAAAFAQDVVIEDTAVMQLPITPGHLDTCRCIWEIPGHSGVLVYRRPGTSTEYPFPRGYGLGQCMSHDLDRAPDCDGADPPAWCSSPWCYVDANACTGASLMSTRYFPGLESLHYSYSTCIATPNSVQAWTEMGQEASQQLIALGEGYMRASRRQVEHTFADYQASASCTDGIDRSMCPCLECAPDTTWRTSVDFLQTGFLAGAAGEPADADRAKCLSRGIATTFLSVAGKEAIPNSRIGFQYFADQTTGSYTQWPQTDWCPALAAGPYDPRKHSWYIAGATGPKDVLIMVDTSGSMTLHGRHLLAKEATKAILGTLTWKDFATIIHYNDRIADEYAGILQPVTDANKANMTDWIDNSSRRWAAGGTSFTVPIARAFEIIENSVSVAQSSMCQRVLMILTDGNAPFDQSDFEDLRRNASEHAAFVFTYALGPQADTVKMKRMACENRGVFHSVGESADLSRVMSRYYEYFAYGQQDWCLASFSRTRSFGGSEVLSACMSMYDRTKPTKSELLGVACMDLDVMADIGQLRGEPGWDKFSCVASDMTKMCRHADLSECDRQQIRRAYSPASVCESLAYADVTAETVCPCTELSCQDNASFTDELHFFCDTWVGDDCWNPKPTWGYSDAAMVEVREQCKRSCGLCDRSSGACRRATSEECPLIPVQQECRACVGKVSGVDINGQPMQCPGGAQREVEVTASAEEAPVSTSEEAAPVSTSGEGGGAGGASRGQGGQDSALAPFALAPAVGGAGGSLVVIGIAILLCKYRRRWGRGKFVCCSGGGVVKPTVKGKSHLLRASLNAVLDTIVASKFADARKDLIMEYAQGVYANTEVKFDKIFKGWAFLKADPARISMQDALVQDVLGHPDDPVFFASSVEEALGALGSFFSAGFDKGPFCLLLAGPPGSGKGFVRERLNDKRFGWTIVDVDSIRTKLPEWDQLVKEDPKTAAVKTHAESALIAEISLHVALAQQRNVIFDSTLKCEDWALGLIRWIRDRRQAYRIIIVYVKTSLPVCRRRCKQREMVTKRHVPPEFLVDAYERCGKTVIKLDHEVDFAMWVSTDKDGEEPVVCQSKLPVLEYFIKGVPKPTVAPAAPTAPTAPAAPAAQPPERRDLGFLKCRVCLDKDCNRIFLPCGHVCICRDCEDFFWKVEPTSCPVCRQNVLSSNAAHF